MATIEQIMTEELDKAKSDGRRPVSWELSAEALVALRAAAHEAGASENGDTAFGLPVAQSDVPGFAARLRTAER